MTERGAARRKQAASALRRGEERLRLALNAANMGTWDWDLKTDALTWDSRQYELFGILPEEFRNVAAQVIARIHTEDRPRVEAAIAEARGRGVAFREEFRVVHPDGSVRWLLGMGQPLQDKGGQVTRMIGVNFEITGEKQNKAALERLNASLERQVAERTQLLSDREERLQAILNTTTDAIITVDHQGIIQSVNSASERMFGYDTAEMIGKNVAMLMPSPYREEHNNYIARYLQTGQKHIIGLNRETEARRKDGTVFPVELAVSEIEHLQIFTGIHRDLTQRKQLEREVVETASQEQRRIGQDLHDSVAQELTALGLLGRDLAETLRTDPANALPLVERMIQGLQRSQQELRDVLRGLLPVAVDSEGLMAALADLADRTRQEGKVACVFVCPKPVTVADNLTATHLYLIAQEALYNAVKHAQAGKVRIALSADRGLVLSVQDDGTGMSEQTMARQGLGLRIMRNRAAIIGAMLKFEPVRPQGTVVSCVLSRKNHDSHEARQTSPRADRR